MTFVIKVVKASRESDQLVVVAQVVEGKEVKLERKFGYALDVDKAVVAAEMQKFLDTYKSDIVIGEQSAEQEAKNAIADDTIASLEGLKVSDKKEE